MAAKIAMTDTGSETELFGPVWSTVFPILSNAPSWVRRRDVDEVDTTGWPLDRPS